MRAYPVVTSVQMPLPVANGTSIVYTFGYGAQSGQQVGAKSIPWQVARARPRSAAHSRILGEVRLRLRRQLLFPLSDNYSSLRPRVISRTWCVRVYLNK